MKGDRHMDEFRHPFAAVMVPTEGQPAPAVDWCASARTDPITGLVAFPDFHRDFPRHLWKAVTGGETVGLAIGDVDNLKDYVETSKVSEGQSFGHLSGCVLMSHLGRIARSWFTEQEVTRGCVATFGGDEIIVALEVRSSEAFHGAVGQLQERLDTCLPRTVSFAASLVTTDQFRAGDDMQSLYLRTMMSIDYHLFHRKADRRASGGTAASFIVLTDEFPANGRRHA
jgi:GGDEF domain-containing protein